MSMNDTPPAYYPPPPHYPPGLVEELEPGRSLWKSLAWLAFGFNLGFVLPLVLAFLVLPLLLPDYAPRPAQGAEVAALPATATPAPFIVVTNIPSPTPSPTTSPSPEPPSPTAPATEVAQLSSPSPLPPSATPFPTATPIPPTATPLPAPASYQLQGIKFFLQTWNNCGPANLAMALSYYGWEGAQKDTAAFLKPEREDRNVSPDQMVAYVNEQTDWRAFYRVAGTRDILRWLVSNNFAVIVETGYQPPGEDWYGHYRTLSGYDDASETFYFYDSNLGTSAKPVLPQGYAEFDRDWQAFSRTYIVVYPPAREAELQAFLGSDWNVSANWGRAAEVARQEAAAEPDNAFAWFNLGAALTMTGDYATAVRAFDQARTLGLPWRMLWYQFTPYEAYYQMSRLDDVMSLAQATIKTTKFVEESYYYMGKVHEAWGEVDTARLQYRTALDYNSNFRAAQQALARLGE